MLWSRLAHPYVRKCASDTRPQSTGILEAIRRSRKRSFRDEKLVGALRDESISIPGQVLKLSSGSGGSSAERSDNGRAPEGRLCRNRRPEVMGANAPVAVTERQNTSPWSSVVSFFLEGLALYAASY